MCSNSTVEAEIVAAYAAVRSTGIPLLDLWECILGRKPAVYLFEDNQATLRIIQTGKYPTLRHVRRMHGVSISWLHDAYNAGHYLPWDCATDFQAADVFTKHFTDMSKWHHALDFIGIVHDRDLLKTLNNSVCDTASRDCVAGRGADGERADGAGGCGGRGDGVCKLFAFVSPDGFHR